MKKYCDLYYTIKHVKTINKKKMYAWFIREKDGRIIQSSFNTEEGGLYDDKDIAELDCRDAIEDDYR